MINQKYVTDLDKNDPLARYLDEFVREDKTLCYLDGNSLGRLPTKTINEINNFLNHEWGKQLVGGWNKWIDEAQRVGDLIARSTLGAKQNQVLATDTTSVNLYRACLGAIKANPNKKTIITDEANFPTDRYIVQEIAKEYGLNLVTIKNDINLDSSGNYNKENELITSEILEKYLNKDVCFVTLSVVQYRSGALNDVENLTKLIHKYGALTIWDASHAVGVVDLKFDSCNIDFAIGCTYKYGNSGPGAPAWIYINEKIQENIHLPIHGWFAQRNQFLMGSEFEQAKGMRGFQIASPSILGLRCIKSSFEIIEDASIKKISEKAQIGTNLMIDLFDQFLAPLGFELTTPRDQNQHGGHITLFHKDAEKIARGLRIHKNLIPDYRVPNCIRLAISPLTNSFSEIYDGFMRIQDYVKSEKYLELAESDSEVT